MNKSTRITVSTLGTIFGLSGISHGFFETLQGNTVTGSLFISAIGEAHRMWPHGNEFAFTLIPNFLITGLVAMLIGLAIIIWSTGFVHMKHGATVFLLLFVMLLLVGGGIAQIFFFPWIWLVATRINSPLTRWRRILPVRTRKPLAKLWLWSLISGSLLFLLIFAIGITGFVPAVNDPDAVLTIMLVCLGAEAVILPLVFVSGFAKDLKTDLFVGNLSW